jgi:hypothetical protein
MEPAERATLMFTWDNIRHKPEICRKKLHLITMLHETRYAECDEMKTCLRYVAIQQYIHNFELQIKSIP